MKPILCILGITFLLYAVSLPNAFVWDDEGQIVDNQIIYDLRNVPEFFGSSTFYAGGAGLSGGFYRPLVSLSYSLNYQIWGLHAWGFRLVQIGFHLLNTFLVFFLLFKLLSFTKVSWAKTAALFASLLFAVHPANVEAVAYIASFGDVLYTSILLLALLVLPISLWGSIALGFLGLFAKETAIVFFPLGFLLLIFLKASRKRLLLYVGGSAAAILSYFFIRLVLSGISFTQQHIAPIAKAALFERLLTIPHEIFTYLQLLVFPLYLSIYRHFVVASFLDIRFWGSLLFLLALGVLSFLFLRPQKKEHQKLFLFSLAWFFFSIGPVLNIIPLDMTVSERWLYFPGIGGMLFLVLALMELAQKGLWQKRVAYGVLIFFAIFFSCRTLLRIQDWKDGFTLYGHDIQYAKGNANLENNYGVELFRKGMIQEAGVHFQNSIAAEDQWAISHNNLGAVLEQEGKLNDAEQEYRRATQISDYYLAYENLGSLLVRTEKFPEAKQFLESAIQKFPLNPKMNILLASLYFKEGDRDLSLEALGRALMGNPSNPELRAFYERMKRGEEVRFE
ncbi:MAG: hypothetical protein Q7R48_02685 [bacterium]|nr:hypothetical protein [bacterium]